MTPEPSGTDGPRRRQVLLSTLLLLEGGISGAILLTVLHVPAGALIGSVLGAMAVNKMSDSLSHRRSGLAARVHLRRLPGFVRVIGQVLLGVLAGARLNEETLMTLLRSLLPVIVAVVFILALSMLLARYLFTRHGVDPLTAVMSAAPGGISELAITAQRQGAVMHVVLAIHLFRVLIVVLLVLPILLHILKTL